MPEKHKSVAVFGVFDVLHDGHRHFLSEAGKLRERLVIILTRDSVVLQLKGRPPRNEFEKRADNLKREALADEIIPGDSVIGAWDSVRRSGADVVALGYDQTDILRALTTYIAKNRLPVSIVTLTPYADGSLHSSTLPRHE